MSQVFADGEKVCQHLGGMVLIGKAVPHRHPCIFSQFFHNLLPESAVLNPLIHPAQYPCGIRNALLLADLGTGRVQIGGTHAQVMGRNLKGAAGPGAGLFKYQGHILSLKRICQDTLFLLLLQFR